MAGCGGETVWHTFRELDELEGTPKGHAFRRFKALRGQWREGREFVVLDARHDAGRIAQLKREGRLYGSTLNAVLLSPEAARAIRAAGRTPAGDG